MMSENFQEQTSNKLEIKKSQLQFYDEGQQIRRLSGQNQSTSLFIEKRRRLTQFIEQLRQGQKIDIDFPNTQSYEDIGVAEAIVDENKLLQLFEHTTRKMTSQSQIKSNWSRQDTTMLLWIAHHYSALNLKNTDIFNQSDWEQISQMIPAKSSADCVMKWFSLKKYSLSDYPWSFEEEQHLKILFQKYKNLASRKWARISKELFHKKCSGKILRSPKQCRQHWWSCINPTINKGPWSTEQDLILLETFLQTGKSWVKIAKVLKARTENAIKNRFNLIVNHKRQKQQLECFTIEDYAHFLIQKLKRKKIASNCSQISHQLSGSMPTYFSAEKPFSPSIFLNRISENQQVNIDVQEIIVNPKTNKEVNRNEDSIQTWSHYFQSKQQYYKELTKIIFS